MIIKFNKYNEALSNNNIVVGIDINGTICDPDTNKAYPNSIVTINNIYDFLKGQGYNMNIVTCEKDMEGWLTEHDIKYDELNIAFDSKDKWTKVNILVDNSSEVIGLKPLSKVSILINKENNNINGDINIANINNLTINIIQDAISKLKNRSTI